MMLYHFTSVERLLLIQRDGLIRVTESNIGSGRPDWLPFGEHVAPDVVWLTDEADPSPEALALDRSPDGTNKLGVRIAVELADQEVAWWPDFRDRHGMHPQWRKAMEKGRDPESWWVVERPITAVEFVSVDVRNR